jgi:hypothetical protein
MGSFWNAWPTVAFVALMFGGTACLDASGPPQLEDSMGAEGVALSPDTSAATTSTSNGVPSPCPNLNVSPYWPRTSSPFGAYGYGFGSPGLGYGVYTGNEGLYGYGQGFGVSTLSNGFGFGWPTTAWGTSEFGLGGLGPSALGPGGLVDSPYYANGVYAPYGYNVTTLPDGGCGLVGPVDAGAPPYFTPPY